MTPDVDTWGYTQTLPCPLNDVFTLNVQGQLVRSQRWFWSRRTKQLYRNRYWLTPQIRPKTVKQRHSFALMETLRTCGDSASLQKYVTRQLLDTSGFFKDPSFDQSRAHGTRYLMLARMDALWTARKAIQIGILVDTHPFSVDRCILCDQQLLSTSIAHLVVECEQVTGHRIQSGLVPAIQKSRLRLLGRALDPGVENVYTWLRGGVLNGEADLDQQWLDGTVEHESMGTRHDNRALAARLADFLQFIHWLTPQIRPKTVKQRHSFALMETLRTCGDSASLQKYVTRQLLDTSGFFKDPSFDQSRAHGTRYLMLARMDALWTARKAIQIGILVDTHPFSVDHCILCDQQLLSTSIAHLVVECEQIAGSRTRSGCGECIYLAPRWSLKWRSRSGPALVGRDVEHESMGTRHDNRALAARLADFLQVAYRQYQSTLWKYHRDRLVEVG
ncbi:hypothetical protein BASA60_001777 [Batrachochytrium salamandrivorans]|nr:hypothetical protein BASA60_001777 [Batrachochytrium salamandrivorans]